MEGHLFVKDGNEDRRFAIGGLRFKSRGTLEMVLAMAMDVGDVVSINRHSLKRVK
jgi:hypothetical protein